MSASRIFATVLLVLGCASLMVQRVFSSLTTGWADVVLIGLELGCGFILIALFVVQHSGNESRAQDRDIRKK